MALLPPVWRFVQVKVEKAAYSVGMIRAPAAGSTKMGSTSPDSALSLADVLRQHREQIVARFVVEVERKDLSPDGLSRPMLVDHIPSFLDEVAGQLETLRSVRTSFDVVDASPTARVHGEQRWSLGYDLEALIREYGVLRHCILATARDVGATASIDEFDVLAKCLNVGVAEAATAYSRDRDRQIDLQRERLEFLAEAGQLLSSSLDYRSTTRRLTALVVPRMADWCAIHLDGVPEAEMPIAHADPTKVDLVRELYVRFPPNQATHGHLDIVRTGEARLVRQIEPGFYESIAESPEHLALMQALDSTSWIMVPLRVQQHTFGVLMLAYSDSKRHYDAEDLALANEVARRAATAIDNARLYSLSQNERARVEAANRAKDEFVAMVSHELRTPLNAILGWLRLMRGGTLDEARRAHAYDVIERNAEAQDRLVADLLDISRVITGKLRITPSQVDVANVVEMAIESVRPAADAKRIRINLEVDRASSVLRADADRLQQVAWNLIANAVKFTPKNGLVDVQIRRVESDIELVVSDNGEGIDLEFLPHVFEIFQQSDRSATRPHGGLGIGLSIVKHIVDLHGGSISAHSAGKGTGATFCVRLPISPLVSTTLGVSRVPATSGTTHAAESLPTGHSGVAVLVVDDDPDARELVTVVLESCGMEVNAVASAAEALALLTTYTPTVLCSDIGLVDEDGYTLIRSIRSLPDAAKQKIPAIALTAFGRNEDRTRALVEGFNVHMAKPVEPAALVRAVLELAGRSV